MPDQIPHADLQEFWGSAHCPLCKTLNWWYAGRYPYDETQPDIEALQCHGCRATFVLIPPELYADFGYESVDDCGTDIGKPKPRDYDA